jgi:endonuclease YncB( thermonuclease family)
MAAKAPEPPPAPAFVPGNAPPQPAAGGAVQTADNAPLQSAAGAPPQPDEAAAPFAMPPTTSFNPVSQPYSLMRDSAAYVAATPDAPQMYPLKAGTAINAVAQSADNKWVIALTENGQAAYLQSADLGPYDPRLAPAPDLPGSVAGVTQVVDTATLTVDGQNVPLDGIKGESGIYAAKLQAMINSQGGQVKCALQGQAYTCTLPDGTDIARAGLFNGGAQLADDASNDYRAQAASAQAAHRGIWR